MLCRNPLIMWLNLPSQYRTILINLPPGYKYTGSSDMQLVRLLLINNFDKPLHLKPSLESS
ncbi:hypothetical protein WP9W18E04_31550 [Aeromonas veronii]|nr:hypothetical protein WP9W18E04_31550 [Aeromonas veronii]